MDLGGGQGNLEAPGDLDGPLGSGEALRGLEEPGDAGLLQGHIRHLPLAHQLPELRVGEGGGRWSA